MSKEVVVYMSPWCSSSADTKRALAEWGVPARFVNIKEDRAAANRLRELVGFESVPTLVIVESGCVEPCEPPAPLSKGSSPRGVDRGSLITEATRIQLRSWLVKQGFLTE
ncbi:MAG: glutaredoxin family protein [Nitrososphaerales archaeon]